jgi:hypothetical protein
MSYAFFTLLAVSGFSCSGTKRPIDLTDENKLNSFYLRTKTTAILIENGFSYCDTTLAGDESCMMEYNGNKYLKRETCSYDSLGRLEKVVLYKAEGILSYDREELIQDSLLMQLNGWQLGDNKLQIKGDSVLSPMAGKIAQFDTTGQRIFCTFKSAENTTKYLMVLGFYGGTK